MRFKQALQLGICCMALNAILLCASAKEQAKLVYATANLSAARLFLKSFVHPVTVWVPPYDIALSKANLGLEFRSPKGDVIRPIDCISHLSLQFWKPTPDGGVVTAIDDKTIEDLHSLGQGSGVKVLLCIYNNTGTWDWKLAQSAFTGRNRDVFITNLLDQVTHYHLDGVDLDLEGDSVDADAYPNYQTNYMSFIKELSARLKQAGKILTIDSFAAEFSDKAPNATWWEDLFPYVEALASMGYTQLGEQPYEEGEWRSFRWQKLKAKRDPRFQIGVPSYIKGDPKETGNGEIWQHQTAQSQLNAIRRIGGMGVGVWDSRLTAPAWHSYDIWNTVQAIRDGEKG